MDRFDCYQAAEEVRDLDTFLRFLETLLKDWETASAAERETPSSPYGSMYGWENTTIGDFLESAIAGARDHNMGKPGGAFADSNAWRQAAEIILLGKVYE